MLTDPWGPARQSRMQRDWSAVSSTSLVTRRGIGELWCGLRCFLRRPAFGVFTSSWLPYDRQPLTTVVKKLGNTAGSCPPRGRPLSPCRQRKELVCPQPMVHTPACPLIVLACGLGLRVGKKALIGSGEEADDWHRHPPFPLSLRASKAEECPFCFSHKDRWRLEELESATRPLVFIPSLYPKGQKDPHCSLKSGRTHRRSGAWPFRSEPQGVGSGTTW